jgi:SNF2 family DNA or RNA helicase
VEKSQEYKGFWTINSITDAFLFDFQDILNPYRVITLKDFAPVLERAQEREYQVVFMDDPAEALEQFEALMEPPDIELDSPFENAINGLLPFQVKAYNYLKGLDAGLMLFSTGTGKTILAAALAKHYLQNDIVDHVIFVAKSHNKVNIQRDFKLRAGLDSVVIEGTAAQRKKLYKSSPQILITNYEKLKLATDKPFWKTIFSKRVVIFYDEAPTKLKHRKTQLYRSLRNLIYKQKFGDFRSPSIKQFVLTATPIEQSPMDFFNVVRLLDPFLLGNIFEFENNYVRSFNLFSNEPQTWKNLDKLGLKTASITYKIDKNDPEIAAQFPRVIEQDIELDWDDSDRKIYDLLHKQAATIFQSQGTNSILPLIMLMQLMCNLPSAINMSAQAYQQWEEDVKSFGFMPQKGSEYAAIFESVVGQLKDDKHSKLNFLKEILLEKHPDEKIIIFSTFNNLVLPAFLMLYIEELIRRSKRPMMTSRKIPNYVSFCPLMRGQIASI